MDYKFPLTVIDGFYKNPNEIVKLANTFEYSNNSGGAWPGVRTAPLHELDINFYEYCANKFLSVFFDLSFVRAQFEIIIQFQKVKDFGKDYLNQGWIHKDTGACCAGVLYLDEIADPNAGTSIYEPVTNDIELGIGEEKFKLYGQGIEVDTYKEKLDKHNGQFIESIKVQNKFNRLVAYDSNYPHCASGHGTHHGERLTQTFFVQALNADRSWPRSRLIAMEEIGKNNLTDLI
jgi:hypothetical protein